MTLAVGDPCGLCAGAGVVIMMMPDLRRLCVECPGCAHVRAAQLKLNATAAAGLARMLSDLDAFDERGVELEPATVGEPVCHHAWTREPGWGWVECDPDTW